jgi:predicted component of type VI protein secretion system
MPWLTTAGASHEIGDGETVVGSGSDADWRIESSDLAARHFVIGRRGETVTVRSCGLDDVIVVNGAQAGSHPIALQDGGTIDAGSARFLFTTARSGANPAVMVGPAHLVDARGEIAYPLETQSVGVGRDRLNAVVIRDPTASRFHAEVRREAGGYVLHPFGSSGTLVNGRRVGSPCRLDDGDRIEIANAELRFVAGAVPAGSRGPGHAVENDESSQRRTIVQGLAIEIPPEEKSPFPLWLWIAVVLVVAATVYVVLR